jgi:hypothetical protein
VPVPSINRKSRSSRYSLAHATLADHQKTRNEKTMLRMAPPVMDVGTIPQPI